MFSQESFSQRIFAQDNNGVEIIPVAPPAPVPGLPPMYVTPVAGWGVICKTVSNWLTISTDKQDTRNCGGVTVGHDGGNTKPVDPPLDITSPPTVPPTPCDPYSTKVEALLHLDSNLDILGDVSSTVPYLENGTEAYVESASGFGDAFVWDGSTSLVVPIKTTNPTAFTVEARVYITGDGGIFGATSNQWSIVARSGNLDAYILGTGWRTFGTLPYNQWVSIAITYQANNNHYLTAFIDGIETVSHSNGTALLLSNISIGENAYIGVYPTGYVDEFRYTYDTIRYEMGYDYTPFTVPFALVQCPSPELPPPFGP